jgi:uncharacterized membrane protein YkvA (DUF1232 family)
MNFKTLKLKAKEMKSNLGIIYLAMKHNRTPWYAKALIFLVVLYALSPIDLIPDFIPVLGYLDDLILVPCGIALAIKFIPADIISECKDNNNVLFDTKEGIYGALIIIVIWITLIYLILRTMFKSI